MKKKSTSYHTDFKLHVWTLTFYCVLILVPVGILLIFYVLGDRFGAASTSPSKKNFVIPIAVVVPLLVIAVVVGLVIGLKRRKRKLFFFPSLIVTTYRSALNKFLNTDDLFPPIIYKCARWGLLKSKALIYNLIMYMIA